MTSLKQTYQKKTDKEHVLDNPDTYIGSIELVKNKDWTLNATDNSIQQTSHDYIPGLYKLFDECVVNARDHVLRCQLTDTPVTYINISIDQDGVITVTNDGLGIDVVEHPEYKMYIPEMIFAHLRTSTNYDKTEKKIVGGKNGFGVKLVFIWSEWGTIETVDQTRKLKYEQRFSNNLDVIEKPRITKCSKKSYTKIVFKPDYKRLGIPGLSDEMKALFYRRVYDIAAITPKKIKVNINETLVDVKDFQQYVSMYIGNKTEKPRVYEQMGDRWEYSVTLTPVEEFTHVSFVNGIYTTKGGRHVEYLMNQIIKKLVAYIKKKKKIEVKASTIKEQIMIFVNSVIENPSFDSQTKDYMNTPVAKFGSSCEVSDKFIEKVAGLGLMDMAISLTEIKDTKSNKKTDGSKTKSIRGIPKLIDANYAGTIKSNQCTLILCEGDSAKAGVVSGLSKEDRNIYGVYPMRGKLLNVRDETAKKIGDNKEITEIKQILGLETGKEYTPEELTSILRYSKVLFMTDQDLDGSHIKGLGINMFDSLWKSLLQIDGFIGFMNTPIIKATKKGKTLLFYNDGEYALWKQQNETGWAIKYYKGLGTSTSKEFKEYFQEKKVVYFKWDNHSENSIDKVFNKKRADDRKKWLGHYSEDNYLDTNQQTVSFCDFVDREMIHFSKYDNDRSIPKLMDGMKISQRKTLFAAFKKPIHKEIKVAQFSGYVSEHSAYHHGEASLNGTIIGMAQDYVGSNNINMLSPKGQFGTRLQGGKDHASERYIFTALEPIARKLFSPIDDAILDYQDDDGYIVEPKYYLPVIPMVLVNGAKGIGTGFSTDIMSYHPKSIMEYIQYKFSENSDEMLETYCNEKMKPYYRGFKGTITSMPDQYGKWKFQGLYKKINATDVLITELPVGSWTDDYKSYLETVIDTKKKMVIRDYEDNSTDKDVNIIVKFAKGYLDNKSSVDLEKLLKMAVIKTTYNMHLFNVKEQLKRYNTVREIIDEFYEERLIMYEKRRQYRLKNIEMILKTINNKVMYIEGLLNNNIDLRSKSASMIESMLVEYGLDKEKDSYQYLTKMAMDSVSKENVEKLQNQKVGLDVEYKKLQSSSAKSLWLVDLEELEPFI
jgi:DNA topoisomerase II